MYESLNQAKYSDQVTSPNLCLVCSVCVMTVLGAAVVLNLILTLSVYCLSAGIWYNLLRGLSKVAVIVNVSLISL